MIAHIDDDRLRVICQFVKFLSFEVDAFIGDIKSIIMKPISDDFVSDLDYQLDK